MKSKSKLMPKSILLILGLIYTLMTILATISYTSSMNNISSTPVTFSSVLGAIWWQILMIVLFALAYVLYDKKNKLGPLVEIIMGIAMLVYIVISIATMGAKFYAILIELVYPLILVFHGLNVFKKQNKKILKKKKSVG